MRSIVAVLGALFAQSAAAQTGFIDRAVTVGTETYRYQVYVPLDYSPNTPWPVIVSLHGSGRQGTDGMQQTATDFGIRIRNTRAMVPAIVVFPQARPGTRFLYPEMEEMVVAELDRTIADYRVDTSRVYLQGNSMGGEGAYRIAYRWPRRFAALVVSAGQVTVDSPPYPEGEVSIDRRANPFSAATDPYSALAAGIRGIPVWLFHSDSDEVISVQQARDLVSALRTAGADVKYTELTGVNHNGTPGKAYQEDLFKWLFAQQRQL